MSLVNSIITTLVNKDKENLEEAILNAFFLFEKFRGVKACGWTQEVIDVDISIEKVKRLQDALMNFIKEELDNPIISSAIAALGNLNDKKLKTVLIEIMENVIDINPDALYQAMIALDCIGEDVFGSKTSRSSLETKENERLARLYIKRQRHRNS